MKSEELDALHKVARKLADTLMEAPPCGAHGASCIVSEATRPLTPEEKKRWFGVARRSYGSYDHTRMCQACAAYWHAQMCANALHDLHCLAIREEACQRLAAQPKQVEG